MKERTGNDDSTGVETGLPWPASWRGVYALVLGGFVVWVGLLLLLTVFFS